MKNLCGIAILICLSSCTHTQFTAPPPTTLDDYSQGHIDGTRDYKPNPAWVLAGVGCGIFGVGLAMVAVPEPPPYQYMDKSPEYAAGYVQAYKAKAKRENATYAVLGWATWIVALVALAQ